MYPAKSAAALIFGKTDGQRRVRRNITANPAVFTERLATGRKNRKKRGTYRKATL
jgi:hypothetical protein